METAVIEDQDQTTEEPVEAPDPPEASDPAAKTTAQMFRYSAWVHVGEGAEECDRVNEQASEVTCDDPEHFHAWCRLPNQFQHRETREKASAARARRVRQLRDPESDGFAVVEAEMDDLARRGEEVKEGLVEELAQKDWWDDTVKASKDLAEIDAEGEDAGKLWEHIERDQLRLREIREMDDEDQPAEELAELVRHCGRYADELEKATNERFEPRKASLMELDLNEIIEQIREQKIEAEGHAAFMDTYNSWAWYIGTLKVKPLGANAGRVERKFDSIEDMQAAAPEVLLMLEIAFGDLETSARTSGSGN